MDEIFQLMEFLSFYFRFVRRGAPKSGVVVVIALISSINVAHGQAPNETVIEIGEFNT